MQINKNSLLNNSSLYLKQHADNPVNWQLWTKDTDLKNKAYILSVGYASCHWCHVMARESFEDENCENYERIFYKYKSR